jgi:zinc transporter
MTSHILIATKINGDGTGEVINLDALSRELEADELAWVHLNAEHEDTQAWLEKEVSYLDPFIIQALLEDETRPRITQIEDGCLLILRGVNCNAGENSEDMVSVRLFIDAHRIISLQRRPVRAVKSIADSLNRGKGPKTSGEFALHLITHLVQRFQHILSDLDESTDNIEEAILESADLSLRKDIIGVRKQSIMFRRHLAPQRDAIAQFRSSEISWLSEISRRQLQEKHNMTVRYVEELDAIRERAQIVKDEIASLIADKLNKNTYVLSVIAAIFLPLGFLTGLLGINIGGIPGTDNPTAFLIFCAMLIVLVCVQIWIFRKLKWF